MNGPPRLIVTLSDMSFVGRIQDRMFEKGIGRSGPRICFSVHYLASRKSIAFLSTTALPHPRNGEAAWLRAYHKCFCANMQPCLLVSLCIRCPIPWLRPSEFSPDRHVLLGLKIGTGGPFLSTAALPIASPPPDSIRPAFPGGSTPRPGTAAGLCFDALMTVPPLRFAGYANAD
jgi:hypothetical protein